MKSNYDLVLLLKEGDEKAFETIFNEYFDGLCLFAESITKDHEVAQDLVEDIFLHLWTNCTLNPVEKSIKGYLYQSTYNNAIKYVARKKHQQHDIKDSDLKDTRFSVLEIQSPDYPVANLIIKELEDKANEAIRSLPEQCRKIYLLNRDEDLNYHQIAQRLNVSDSTVKTQMSRAFAKLREFLKEFLPVL